MVTAVAFLTVLLEKKLGRNVWRGILSYWFFIMSWIPINFICLFKRPATWEQIKHERSMRLQDISKSLVDFTMKIRNTIVRDQ